jgi:hypothetical protein
MNESRAVLPGSPPLRRKVLAGLALASMGFAGTASCILADPPPTLPTYIELPPVIYGNSAMPPASLITVGWPQAGVLEFTVPVQVYGSTNFYVFEDYGGLDGGVQIQTDLRTLAPEDGGGVQLIDFSADLGGDSGASCHTITLFADADSSAAPNAPTGCVLCSYVTWTYDPTGAGGCATFDAGAPEASRG